VDSEGVSVHGAREQKQSEQSFQQFSHISGSILERQGV